MQAIDISYIEIIKSFGFPVASLVCVAFFLSWLIKYVLKENGIREQNYIATINNFNKHFDSMTDKLCELKTVNEEAHKWQRIEHESIIKRLDKTL